MERTSFTWKGEKGGDPEFSSLSEGKDIPAILYDSVREGGTGFLRRLFLSCRRKEKEKGNLIRRSFGLRPFFPRARKKEEEIDQNNNLVLWKKGEKKRGRRERRLLYLSPSSAPSAEEGKKGEKVKSHAAGREGKEKSQIQPRPSFLHFEEGGEKIEKLLLLLYRKGRKGGGFLSSPLPVSLYPQEKKKKRKEEEKRKCIVDVATGPRRRGEDENSRYRSASSYVDREGGKRKREDRQSLSVSPSIAR